MTDEEIFRRMDWPAAFASRVGRDDFATRISALVRAAEAAEREVLRELMAKAREVAEWHVGDGDECGTLARIVIAKIDSLAL